MLSKKNPGPPERLAQSNPFLGCLSRTRENARILMRTQRRCLWVGWWNSSFGHLTRLQPSLWRGQPCKDENIDNLTWSSENRLTHLAFKQWRRSAVVNAETIQIFLNSIRVYHLGRKLLGQDRNKVFSLQVGPAIKPGEKIVHLLVIGQLWPLVTHSPFQHSRKNIMIRSVSMFTSKSYLGSLDVLDKLSLMLLLIFVLWRWDC